LQAAAAEAMVQAAVQEELVDTELIMVVLLYF
jgi:hypothetical protein